MIWLESEVGTPEKVADYTTKAAALKTAINARLWNAPPACTSTPTPGRTCSRSTPT